MTYYESHRRDLGLAFLAAIERTVDLAAESPRSGPLVMGPAADLGVRKFVVTGFPYLVLVACEDEPPQVMAISHTSRRPGYWEDRLK
ncbi:MAG: hypothetical protein P1V51_24885 [Deltaproteobacteria bacterium]|nr:hypothetical protein [Deltaproteobacteria bacterium]